MNLCIIVETMKMYWDFMKMLVAEELEVFTNLTTGRVPAQKLPAMMEAAAVNTSNLMGLLHKKILVGTTRRYTLEFREKDADSGKAGSAGKRKKPSKARLT